MEFGEDFRPFTATIVQRPRQQVEEQIRAAIRSGTLKPGEKLPTEVALSRDFGVSRTTIREALRSLVSDGLIEKSTGAGGGSFVRVLDHVSVGSELGQDLENLLKLGSVAHLEASHARRIVGLPCARLAAEHRTDADLSTLHRILGQEAELPSGDPKLVELNSEFHATVGQASGNRILAALVIALNHAAGSVSEISDDARTDRVRREHVEIASAIESRDAEAAEKAMLEHLT